MLKTLLALSIVFSLSGCVTKTKYVYLSPKCPTIQVLTVVPRIDGNIVDGCVCGAALDSLLTGTTSLRSSERYYIQEVSKYNNEFTNQDNNLTSVD